ncbi:OB-fold domain-containing protein [Pseudonocardia alni]|uniref:Zn-ribbon domain-containing OB-fold protein n=1 Tax=Pseudonocardia alni TaxID=33907 RepID=UPI003328ECCD
MTFVDDGLLTDTPDGPALLGSRCTDCGAHTFPRQTGCPRCSGARMADVPLHRTGTLWTWTVQGFRPKPPYTGTAGHEPYGVGYVELDGQLLVEARLTESDPARLRIGMPMELAIVPFRQADDGPTHTFAFAPAGDPS